MEKAKGRRRRSGLGATDERYEKDTRNRTENLAGDNLVTPWSFALGRSPFVLAKKGSKASQNGSIRSCPPNWRQTVCKYLKMNGLQKNPLPAGFRSILACSGLFRPKKINCKIPKNITPHPKNL